MNVNIAKFIEWFIQQFINIGTQIINIIDSIIIYGNVSLLDFIIAITILGMFLSLILTIPQNAMSKAEKSIRENKRKERNKNDK